MVLIHFFLFILFKKVERIVGDREDPRLAETPSTPRAAGQEKVSGDSSPTQTKRETDRTQEHQRTVLPFVLRGQWPEYLGHSLQTTSNRTVRECHGPSWEWWGSYSAQGTPVVKASITLMNIVLSVIWVRHAES